MLLPYFQWFETTTIGTAIKNSSWAFAVIESVHLLALAVIGGAVLMLDLRLLGLGLRRQPIPEVAREAQPWLVGSLIVMRPIVLRLVALVSLTLWFGVGAGGRWIGFSG